MNNKIDLRPIESKIQKTVFSIHSHIPKILQEFLRQKFLTFKPGMHSKLLILFNQLGKNNTTQQVINLAAGVELFHFGIQLHDDLNNLDKLNTQLAIYAGDYLFVISLELFEQNIHQTSYLEDNMIDLQDVLFKNANAFPNKKENTLYELACFLGAYIGKMTSDQLTYAREFGRLLDDSQTTQAIKYLNDNFDNKDIVNTIIDNIRIYF